MKPAELDINREQLIWLLKHHDIFSKGVRSSLEIANYIDGAHFTALGCSDNPEKIFSWSLYKFFSEYHNYYAPLFKELHDLSTAATDGGNLLGSVEEDSMLVCKAMETLSRSSFSEQEGLAVKRACSRIVASFAAFQQRINDELLEKLTQGSAEE